MSNSLLMFTIGPVQSFIAQARKTRDLYAGSFLLSYLIKNVVKKAKELGVEIIFPSDNYFTAPNRLAGIIKNKTDKEKDLIGNILESYVKGQFIDVANKVMIQLNIKPPQAFYDQIENFLEVFWVFCDFNEDYNNAYNQATIVLSNMKRLRPFEQQKQDGYRKCTLNPEHNALFAIEKTFMLSSDALILKSDEIKNAFNDKSEALSAVSFVKRFLHKAIAKNQGYNHNFPSISDIVVNKKFLEFNKDSDFNNAYKTLFKDEREFLDYYNGNIKFENSEEKSYADVIKTKLKGAKITPYYAIIKFDGDSMGRKYSEPPIKDMSLIKQYHQYLSEQMCQFAVKVREYINSNPGTGVVVYAGGEDFLGFIHIDSLLEVIKKLRKDFGEIDLSQYCKEGVKLTFSAGIAIAHYKAPLSTVIKAADEMEHYAKDIDENKDALAIAVLKHSGEIIKSRLKFGTEAKNIDTLAKAIQSIRNADISRSYIYKLVDVLNRLIDDTGLDCENLDAMIECEILRLLKRNAMRVLNEKELTECANSIKSVYNISRAKNGINEFIDILQIIVFLSREVDIQNDL